MSYTAIAKRDRLMVLVAKLALAALAWGYTIYLTAQNASMAGAMTMPNTAQWSQTDFVFIFIMWAVMMFAMMFAMMLP